MLSRFQRPSPACVKREAAVSFIFAHRLNKRLTLLRGAKMVKRERARKKMPKDNSQIIEFVNNLIELHKLEGFLLYKLEECVIGKEKKQKD